MVLKYGEHCHPLFLLGRRTSDSTSPYALLYYRGHLLSEAARPRYLSDSAT
jgi:hypothetical protein